MRISQTNVCACVAPQAHYPSMWPLLVEEWRRPSRMALFPLREKQLDGQHQLPRLRTVETSLRRGSTLGSGHIASLSAAAVGFMERCACRLDCCCAPSPHAAGLQAAPSQSCSCGISNTKGQWTQSPSESPQASDSRVESIRRSLRIRVCSSATASQSSSQTSGSAGGTRPSPTTSEESAEACAQTAAQPRRGAAALHTDAAGYYSATNHQVQSAHASQQAIVESNANRTAAQIASRQHTFGKRGIGRADAEVLASQQAIAESHTCSTTAEDRQEPQPLSATATPGGTCPHLAAGPGRRPAHRARGGRQRHADLGTPKRSQSAVTPGMSPANSSSFEVKRCSLLRPASCSPRDDCDGQNPHCLSGPSTQPPEAIPCSCSHACLCQSRRKDEKM